MKTFNQILIEYLNNNSTLFERGRMRYQIQEIWLELFNEKLTLEQCNSKICILRNKGFIFKYQKDSLQILIAYLNNNSTLFEKGRMKYQFQEIWFKLFNKKLTLKQCDSKICILRNKGFIFKYQKYSFQILIEYLNNNSTLFERGRMGYQIQDIWLELFNEKLTLRQCDYKIRFLKGKGFIFNYQKDSFQILIEYLNNNSTLFEKGRMKYQFQEIWFKLFNKKLTLKQCNSKIHVLKNKGFIFKYQKDSLQTLIAYLNNNSTLFEKGRMKYQFQEIWFKLFNKKLTLKQCDSKIGILRNKGFIFNYQKDSFQILIEYINNNSTLFEKGRMRYQFQEIWFKLFNKKLTLKQCNSKIHVLKNKGFIFKYQKDSLQTLIAYLNNNSTLFEKGRMKYQFQEIWFKLFNKKLTLKQCDSKICILRNKGFIFKYQKYSFQILIEYLNNNSTLFEKGRMIYQIQDIWFKLFNKKLTLKQCKDKTIILRDKGFIFKYQKDSFQILIEYLNNNSTLFEKGRMKYQIQEIWLRLFNEELTLIQCSNKIQVLKNRGFIFKYQKDSFQILIAYLNNNSTLFEKGRMRYQIQEIWLKLFNEKLTLIQCNSKITGLKNKGFIFKYKKDYIHIFIEYLKKKSLWLKESINGYKKVQIIWEELFKKEISTENAKSIIIKISLLSPEHVHRKIPQPFVSFYNLDKLSQNEYDKYSNIFGFFCRKNNIILTKDIDEKKLARIWSVCFAESK